MKYPLNCFPPIMRAAIENVQLLTKAPVEIIAGSALGALSIACQGVIDVKRRSMAPCPVSLYLITVADSGERKSSVDRLFFDPVNRLDNERREIFFEENRRYRMELEPWESAAAGLKKKISSQAQRGDCTREAEHLLMQHMERKPEPPNLKRILYSDTTPQALLMTMSAGNPNAALHSNEAGQLLNGRPMSDLPILNKIWDGQRISVDRVDQGRTVEMPSPRLTISFQLQPRTFDKFCSREDARDVGFLARALMCKPASTAGHRMLTPMDVELSNTELEKFNERLVELLDSSMQERQLVEFSDEAAQIWQTHYNEVEHQMREFGRWSLIKDFASKMSENVARIAALFEYVQTGRLVIGLNSMLGAIEVMNWYCLQFDEFFGSGLQKRTDIEMASKLRKWILSWSEAHPGQRDIPVRHVYRFAPKCVRQKSDLERVLLHLEGFAWLVSKNGYQGAVLHFEPPVRYVQNRFIVRPPPLAGY